MSDKKVVVIEFWDNFGDITRADDKPKPGLVRAEAVFVDGFFEVVRPAAWAGLRLDHATTVQTYSAAEAADVLVQLRILAVAPDVTTVYRWVRDGEFPGALKRPVRIPHQDLVQFVPPTTGRPPKPEQPKPQVIPDPWES